MFAHYFNKTPMLVFYEKVALINHLNAIKTTSSTLGFVPTMGALHQGHLALMERALQENQSVVVSIFVNPNQFNNPEDLVKYPRTFEQDVKKIKTLNNSIILYAPTVADVYEENTKAQAFDFDGLENLMEGKFRPGHFNGVGTVVKRLFEIINPTNAYFGEKDFQQLQIIKKLVSVTNLKVNIIGCPIYREKNKLAMSSRNERLSPLERQQAAIIYKTLLEAKTLFKTKSAKTVEKRVLRIFKKNKTFALEYFQITNEATLLPCLRKNKNKHYRAFIAVFVNGIRLIDTMKMI